LRAKCPRGDEKNGEHQYDRSKPSVHEHAPTKRRMDQKRVRV